VEEEILFILLLCLCLKGREGRIRRDAGRIYRGERGREGEFSSHFMLKLRRLIFVRMILEFWIGWLYFVGLEPIHPRPFLSLEGVLGSLV
jgi:hypothetical protein